MLISRCAMGMAIFAMTHLGFAANPTFTRQEIMPGQAPWGKQLADLDGDGFVDIVEAGGYINYARVYWFRYPTWERFQIAANGGDDDLQVGDINNDGAPDIVVNEQICWLENPRGTGGDVTAMWTKHIVDAGVDGHDLALGDLDRDGKLDIVSRGEGGAGPTYIYFQNAPDEWTRVQMTNVSTGEGTAIADIDRDGKPDLIGNGYWLKQPPNPRADVWPRFDFGTWEYIAGVGVADINNDGRLDILLSPSETGPGTLAWFEAPPDPTAIPWTRHDIIAAEDIHRFHVADVNGDGQLDIFFGEMQQSATKRLGILNNNGAGASWTPDIIATTGAHNIAVGDVGNDGDLDILNANWNVSAPDGASIHLWINGANGSDITPPTVAITSPAQDEVVSGTVTLSAAASDNVAVAGVQFMLDGALVGDEDTEPPFELVWNSAAATLGDHSVQAIARDISGNTTSSTPVRFSVAATPDPDLTPPSVAILSPADTAIVAGMVTISAEASDDVELSCVQFQVDGAAISPEYTCAPFACHWNTGAAPVGAHTLRAVARDKSGNVAISQPITVTVRRASQNAARGWTRLR